VARAAWSEYFINANAIVFMVDAANQGRCGEEKAQLEALLADGEFKGSPFLILGNKIDEESCIPAEVLVARLGIASHTTQNAKSVQPGQPSIRVLPCSVKQKSGYTDEFHWLAKFIYTLEREGDVIEWPFGDLNDLRSVERR
jgi:GTPase SAR1 family protein